MLSQLNWAIRTLVMLSMGTALCVSMLILARPRLLRYMGALPYLSPNWLTLWRLPIVDAGMIIYFQANGRDVWLIAGLLIIVFGLTLDRIDGKVAKSLIQRLHFLPGLKRYRDNVTDIKKQQILASVDPTVIWAYFNKEGDEHDSYVLIEQWIAGLMSGYTLLPMFKLELEIETSLESSGNHITMPGRRLSLTGIGDWLDPLIDKVNLLPLLIYMGHLRLISIPLIALMILVDLIGTVIRKPFINRWPFKVLQPYVRESKASAFGKTKVLALFLTLLSQIPATSGGGMSVGERHASWWIASTLLGISVVAGVLSVVSRLTLMEYLLALPGLRRFNKSFKEVYEHNVTEEE